MHARLTQEGKWDSGHVGEGSKEWFNVKLEDCIQVIKSTNDGVNLQIKGKVLNDPEEAAKKVDESIEGADADDDLVDEIFTQSL